MRKQYIKVRPGIRQHLGSRRYQAYKRVDKKQFTKTFRLIRDAQIWLKREWNLVAHIPSMSRSLEGYIKDYLAQHVSTLERSSQMKNSEMLTAFTSSIKDLKLRDIKRSTMTELIQRERKIASSKRCSFRNELKLLNAFFNWINLRVEEFNNPITKDHHKLGQIKKARVRNNKIEPRKVYEFLSNSNGIFQDLAYFQFFTASRIGEACGIQVESVDFKSKLCLIAHNVSWDRSKRFIELKDYPKNKHSRTCHLPEEVLSRLKLRIGSRTSGYVFTIDGSAMKYRSIQHEYNKALKKADIKNVSVTHFLRHSSASIVRDSSNSLDFAQAMTGHKDRSVVEKTYTKVNLGTQKLALQHLVDSMHKVMEK